MLHKSSRIWKGFIFFGSQCDNILLKNILKLIGIYILNEFDLVSIINNQYHANVDIMIFGLFICTNINYHEVQIIIKF